MKLLVLAGGFGTRLKRVVSDVPKPLAPVAGVPFLHYQVEHWVAQGIRSFVFLLHHQADLVQRFIDERRTTVLSGCAVDVIVEPEPLDTGGAVAHAVLELGLRGEFLITNADTWLGGGVQELTQAGADTMVVVGQPDVARYGHIEFDRGGLVQAFREKGGLGGRGWINAGMCQLRASHFDAWDGGRLSLERDVFPRLLAAQSLRALPLELEFIDIGVPDDYERFCLWQRGGREGRLCS